MCIRDRLLSCQSTDNRRLEQTLDLAQSHRGELENVIQYYRDVYKRQDPSPYQNEAEQILKAMNKRLWMQGKG